ncbi:MAG: NAD(P)H-dependent oxidoreductase [Methanoregula sp.]|jgi:putative NADPH-quinone reductase|nr:NAD(P)H-dependent oxidoreductase [Methanoregula sp.]
MKERPDNSEIKISVILAHPHPGSFNHAIADTVVKVLEANGHAVIFHDLYEERFDPVLPYAEISRNASLSQVIAQHCTEIAAADGIIFVHPDWWGMPPAILKGWIDRVLRPGITYRFLERDDGDGVPEGLLKAKTALVFNTSNTPWERELEAFGDPLERLWKDCICSFCGITVFHRRMFGVIVTSTDEQRKIWLEEVKEIILGTFPHRPR